MITGKINCDLTGIPLLIAGFIFGLLLSVIGVYYKAVAKMYSSSFDLSNSAATMYANNDKEAHQYGDVSQNRHRS